MNGRGGQLLPTLWCRARTWVSSSRPPQANIRCFSYAIEDGVCYLAICRNNYSKKLAFAFLEDIQREFHVRSIAFFCFVLFGGLSLLSSFACVRVPGCGGKKEREDVGHFHFPPFCHLATLFLFISFLLLFSLSLVFSSSLFSLSFCVYPILLLEFSCLLPCVYGRTLRLFCF